MNNVRRRELASINKDLGKIHKVLTVAQSDLKRVYNELNLVYDDEEEAFGNLNDGLQATWNGQISEEAIGNMSEAIELLDVAMEKLAEATDCIEEAQA